MKQFVLTAIIALTGSFATAGALDNQDAYQDHTPVYTTVRCKDGATAIFTEGNSVNDRTKTVTRTCVNGSYYPKSTVVVLACKEGSINYEPVFSNVNDRIRYEARVCRGGKYVKIGN